MSGYGDSDLTRQVEGLKQRRGRTLSIVDLVLAGTLSIDAAAAVAAQVRRRASFFTGAVPGGAGKTSVLAALMGLLPRGEPVVTVEHPNVLAAGTDGPTCWLVHEINDYVHYGYIWGAPVRELFARREAGDRVVSCMHADGIDEMRAMLAGPPNRVTADAFALLDLALFIRVTRRAGEVIRRVSAIYEAQAGRHVRIFEWDPGHDSHRAVAPSTCPTPDVADMRARLEALVERGMTDWAGVRDALVT